MAYLSLYRKYRSQSFQDVQGQDHVTRTLQNAVRTERVAHAYLFCGPRGTGKTSTARLLAKALNCEQGPQAEPCNQCTACVEITEGRFMDVKEIDAASNRGIDDIRDLRDTVAYAPAAGRCKVYVIDEVHQITTDAFNALLKTLEEPPPRVVFILATTETHKVPATIVSRCQRFEFRRASVEQLRERVEWVAQQEGASIEPAALDLIARDANGGWRDALSLLEQVLAFAEGTITAKDVYAVLGTVEADTLHELAGHALSQTGADLFSTLDRLICEGKDPRQLLRDITAYYRVLMLSAAGSPPPGDPDQAARIQEQARGYGQARLIQAIEVLAQTEREARWSEQPRLLLELALVRLMHPREAGALVEARSSAPQATRPAAVQQQPAARPTAPPPATRPTPPATTPQQAPPASRPAPRVESGWDSPSPASTRPAAAPPASSSPFVDEAPPADFHSAMGGGAELPPPPLTVGDARAGDDGDDDYSALFGDPPPPNPEAEPSFGYERARPAAQPVSRPPQPSYTAPVTPPPAVSAPPSTPASSGAAPGFNPAAGDVKKVQSKWRVIMEELRRAKKINIHIFLADSQPDRFEGDELVVLLPSQGFVEQFQKKGKAFSDPLSEAISKVTGIQCRIRAQYKGTAGAPPPSSFAPPSGRPAAPPVETAPPPVQPATPPPSLSWDQPAPETHAAAPPARTPVSRPPGPSDAPVSGMMGEELLHNLIDIYDGRVVDDREL